jgi:hypothetical protein
LQAGADPPLKVSHIAVNRIPWLAIISILVGLSWIALETFRWENDCYMVPGLFLFTILYCLVPPILLVLLGVSGLYVRRSRAASNHRRAWLPLVINFGALLIVVVGLLTRPGYMYHELKFRWNQDRYDEVIRLVGEGRVQPDPDGFALLPPEYWFLSSCGGEIMIDMSGGVTRVFFFTYRDMFDDFAGYQYRSDNQPPERNDFSNRPNAYRGCGRIEQKRPYWFYCNHT